MKTLSNNSFNSTREGTELDNILVFKVSADDSTVASEAPITLPRDNGRGLLGSK